MFLQKSWFTPRIFSSRSLIRGTRLMLGYTREMLVTANEAKIEARDAGTTTTRRSQLTSEFSDSPEVRFWEASCRRNAAGAFDLAERRNQRGERRSCGSEMHGCPS